MLNKFKQKIESLIPESYRHDVERLRVAKIFIWICVCALPLVLMQGVVSVLTVGDQLIAVACFSMFCLYAFVLFMFVKNVPYVIVIDTLIAFSLAVFTYITYRNGGMYAPPFPLIVVFPGFAIVMTGRLNSVIWLLAVIAVAVMLYGETIKGNPEVIQVPLAFVPNYLSIVFVVIVIVFVIFLVSDNARKTAQMETVMALEKVQRSQLMVMRQERLASFGQLAAGMAHEIQNPLNFINNFSDMSVEQLDELQEKVAGNAEAETMIEEVKENVQRVHNYGIRASEILRGMLEQTRVKGSERKPTNIKRLSREFMQHAYYGFRTKYPLLECSMLESMSSDIPILKLPEKDLARVLMNVFQMHFTRLPKKKRAEKKFF